MEAKFKVGDRITWGTKDVSAVVESIGITEVTFVPGEWRHVNGGGVYRNCSHATNLNFLANVEILEEAKPSTPAITIGSTWYWQGGKDSPVTVIGFDSKGRVVVESGFEFQSSDENYEKGSVFKIESEFTDCYTNTPKAKKLTGYVRVLKPIEGYLMATQPDRIFQSAVFSDEAKARAAVPYGFDVVDVVKVEWEEAE